MYNDKFSQNLGTSIKCDNHNECLQISSRIRKQCEAWDSCVSYTESKSARKGDVLYTSIMMHQIAYASNVLIFKEATRRFCFQFNLSDVTEVIFHDMGAEPVNDLRKRY